MALCISYMSWHAMGLVHALSPISTYFTIIWSHGCARTSIVCIKPYFDIPQSDERTRLCYGTDFASARMPPIVAHL